MITGKAKIAGVFGWPVGHSRSPQLHNHWLAAYGIDGVYIPLAVHPDDFAQVVRTLPKMGFRGANVTVPHKEAALRLCDRVDPTARRMGAVNTLVVEPDGTLSGSNTDGFGFLANLEQSVPGWSPRDGVAVLVGAGGSARSLAVALLEAGAPGVRIVNRTRERAERLAAEIGGQVEVADWESRAPALADANLLVNTTTQGMVGEPPLDLDLRHLPPAALVTDIVYVPLETPLLAAARQRGNPAVDGLGMLIHQARPGFAAWYGTMPEATPDIRAMLLRTL